MADAPKERMGPGALAMIIIIPVSLIAFAIDGVVLLAGDRADREAAAQKHAAIVAAAASAEKADAAPTAGKP